MTRTCSLAPRIARPALLLLALASLGFSAVQDEPPEPGLLTVYVVDEDGEPAFKASVALSPTKEQMDELAKNGGGAIPMDTQRTDPDGFAILSVPPGEERIVDVLSPDYTFRTEITLATMAPGEEREIEVTLKTRDDATFTGRVIGPDGKPLTGALVETQALGGWSHDKRGKVLQVPRNPAAKTDADGLFDLSAATWRSSSVTVHAEGFAPRRLFVGGEEGKVNTEAPVAIPLSTSSTIAVIIDGLGEGVVVYAVGRVSSLFGAQSDSPRMRGYSAIRFRARVAADGAHVLTGLPPATSVRLLAEVGRKTVFEVRSFMTPASGETVELQWDLTADRSISGVLVDEDGAPIPGESIWIKGDGKSGTRRQFSSLDEPTGECTTDADGRFMFTDIPAAVYRVGIAYDNPYGDRSDLVVLTLLADAAAGEDPAPVELVGVRGLFIRGRVVDPDGEPTAGTVFAHNKASGHHVNAKRVAQDGVFELGPLLRAEYSITGMPMGSEHAGRSESVTRAAGAEDVLVKLRRGGVIEARIVGLKTGQPLRASVTLAPLADDGISITDSGTDGMVRFARVLTGAHVLSATAAGDLVGHSQVLDLSAGQTIDDVVIELSQGTRVRIECMDHHGALNIMVTTATGFRGIESFSVPGVIEATVPVGEVTFEFLGDRMRSKAPHTLEVKLGEVVTWKVSLPPEKGDDQRDERR